MLALVLGLFLTDARAADITVTSAGDPGAGSLRQAIADVPAGGTINFAAGLGGQTISLNSEILLAKAVTIDASGLSGGVTLSGGGVTRLFRVNSGGNLTLRGFSLTGGKGAGAANNGLGGAIYNVGTLTVERCLFSQNTASNNGGGIHNGLLGILALSDTAFNGNSASLYGGGVSNSGTLTISRCTFSANSSNFQGGGIYTDFSGTLVVANSTFTGNTANFYGGAIFNGSPSTVSSSTLIGNSAVQIGGGVYSDFFGTLALDNSIVTGNTAPEDPDVFGGWTGAFNFTSGDPKLSPLGDWGGPTQTMPPLPNSPVIDAGGSTSLPTDQRGLARVLGDGLDIGAFETPSADYNPDGLTIKAKVPQTDTEGFFEISTDPNFLPYVSSFAGTGSDGFADGPRLSAEFSYPSGVAQDVAGNFFIADAINHRIRMITPQGAVSTIAGNGSYGLANGPGPSAQFAFPSALAIGPDGNVYVADTYNHRICKLTRPVIEGDAWTVTNLAGTGVDGFLNGAGSVARFSQPYGLVLDAAGNVFVADSLNHRIRKVTPAGSVSTFAGSGTDGFLDALLPGSARFSTPQSLVLAGGNLFVADTFNDRIREIAIADNVAGAVTTFAGSSRGFAEGTGSAAQFDTPSGIATDGAGTLFVVDEANHRIRRITAAAEVTTVAGTGSAGLVNGDSTVARFNSPTGVAFTADENLVVADAQNHTLRRIVIKPLTVIATLVPGSEDGSEVQVNTVLDVVALGLDPGVTYYFRWKSSTTGTTQPLGQSFFLYDFPTVVTGAASELIPTSARLNATVDPKFGATEVVFTYSTEPDLRHPYELTTLAGAGQFASPSGVVADAGGNVYVSDRLNHRIRKITPLGVVGNFAGSGDPGFSNDNGIAARFENPAGLAIDASGNIYVADESNHCIRMITPAGVVSTFAGSGVAGFDDGDKATAKFLYPAGVAVDADGNVYVADTGNHRIRKITAASGAVTTLGGTGVGGFTNGASASSQFSSPRALAVVSANRVLVADTGNRRIRVIEPGGVSTLAGEGGSGFLDGPGGTALFALPMGIAMDGNGVAYVTDGPNHRIRRIETSGQVTTLAGSGIAGAGDSPAVGLYPVTACQFDSPVAIAISGADDFFITQEGRVRKLARSVVLPTLTVAPDATGSGERLVSAAVSLPLLPGATYYFQATGTNYRGTVSGEILSFMAPQSAISVFAGINTSAPALLHGQASPVEFGSTPNGQPATRSFTIFNPGGWPLAVSAVAVPAGYQVSGGVGNINSLGSLTFEITLPATSGGSFGGEVAITSDAPGQPVFSFPISGEVLDPPALLTLAASDSAAGTATFHAVVNPNGSSTTVWFEWSQDPEFDGVMVRTVAGSQLDGPSGVATDELGNIYVADTKNHRIRKISPNGDVVTFAGSGVAGFADGPGGSAQFDEPVGLAMSSSGILFVADSKNHRIRAINPAGGVATYSGLGTAGFTNGIPSAARFHTPAGLAIDGSGVLYVADSGNHRIRTIQTDGSVGTLSGTGIAGAENGAGEVAQFNSPLALARDSAGFLYVTEAATHAIRRIAPDGFTNLFAGFTAGMGFLDASGTAARFASPAGLAVGVDGSLYVADSGNHRIRKISPGGVVTTVAGSGMAGTVDGFGEVARFSSPFSLAATGTGELIIGESGSSTIREISSLQVLRQAATGLTGTADLTVELPVSGLPLDAPYYFRAIATNGGGTTVGNIKDSGTTFLAWQIANFGADASDPLIVGPLATPAGDGVANLLKYALGLEPLASAAGAMPAMEMHGGALSLTYTKLLAATDIIYSVEWSADLTTWSPLGVTEQLVSGDGIARQIRASVPAAPATAKFLRLQVTAQ